MLPEIYLRRSSVKMRRLGKIAEVPSTPKKSLNPAPSAGGVCACVCTMLGDIHKANLNNYLRIESIVQNHCELLHIGPAAWKEAAASCRLIRDPLGNPHEHVFEIDFLLLEHLEAEAVGHQEFGDEG